MLKKTKKSPTFKRLSKDKEKSQRTRELKTVYEIGALINDHLGNLDVVFPVILEKVASLTGYEMGAIFLLNETEEVLEMKSQIGHSPAMLQEVKVLKFNEGVYGETIRLKKPVIVSIREYPSPRIDRILREEGVQTVVGIPLLGKGKAVGAIILSTRSPRQLSRSEVDSLESVGNHIGIALENAELLSTIAKAKSEWETTFDAVTDLIIILDKDYRIIRANASAFKRYGLRPEEMIGKRCFETLHQGNKPCEGCYVTEALKTKKPASGERDSKYLNGIFQYFTFPVYDEVGEVVAVVDLTREITEEKRLEIEREVVGNVNKILASSLDLKQGIRSVYAELKKVLDCERMTIALFDEDGKGFRYFALEKDYEAGELVGDVLYPMQGTRFERMAKSGEPEIVGNTEIDSWIGRKLLQEERIRSVLLFPLEYKGKIFGTVNFGSTKLKHFSGDQFNLLRQIAPGLAIFIQNTLLFEEIKGSEEKYRTVVESAIDGVCVIGRDYLFKYVNGRLAEIQGYTREELIGTDFRNLLDEESRTLLADREDKRARGIKLPPHFELNIFHKDGGVRNAEISASAIKDSKGYVNIIVFLKDITERKQAEEALRQSEEKYRTILEEMQEGYFETDLSGNLTFINDAGCRNLGYPREELIGVDNRMYADEENRKKTVQAFTRVYRTGEPGTILDYELTRKDGAKVIIELSVSLMKNSEGKPIGFRGISHHVTERKQMEEALRHSEERYRTIIESIQDGYFEVDLAGNFTFVNDAESVIHGYSRDELIGMNFRQYTDEEYAKKVFQAFNKLYKTGVPIKGLDYEIIRKDGTKGIYEVSVFLIRDSEGKPIGFRGTSRDITERRQGEKALRESEETARRLSQENATVAEIGRIISSTLNIEEVYERFAEEVRKVLPFDRVSVNTIDPDFTSIAIAYTFGVKIGDSEEGMHITMESSVYEGIVNRRSSILLQPEDENELADRYPNFVRHFRAGLRSIIATPLISQDQLIGILHIQSLKPHAYTKSDVKLVERVGNQIAGAIANAQLFAERKQAEEALRTEKQRFQTVSENAPFGMAMTDQTGTFKYINPKFKELFGYDLSDIPDGKTWFRKAFPDPAYRHQVISTWIDDIGSQKPGEKIIRIFRVTCKDGAEKISEFSPVKLETGEHLTSFVDITRRKEAEDALQRSEEAATRLAQENATVAEIGRIISSTLNIEEVYERFAEEVRKLIPLDRIALTTINPDHRSGTMAYVLGVEIKDRNQGNILPLIGTFYEEIFSKRSGILVQTEDESELVERYPILLSTFRAGLLSMISVPLVSKGQVIGVLHIRSLKPNAYTELDLKLAERVGNQIAGAIANVQLFTERKQMEEALHENKNRLQALLDASPIGISWADMNGNIQYTNRKFVQLFGYTVDDIPTVADWRRLAYPDPAYRKTVPSLIAKLTEAQKQGGEISPIEMTIKCKDGSTRYVEQMGTFVSNRILAIYNDLTERKQMEEALRESENKFRSLVENSIVGVYLIQEGLFKYVNARLAEIHGYEVEEMVGRMGPTQATCPEDLPIVERNIDKRMNGEEESIHYEFRIVTKSQEIRYVEVFGSHTMYQGISAVLGTMLDITDRKKAEEALRQSEEKYRTILEDIQEGYFEVDLAGNFTFVNDAQCRNLGYAKEELIGMNNRQYTSEKMAKKIYELFNKVYRTGKSAKGYDLELIKKDGTKTFSEISVSLVRDSEAKKIGFRGISRDVTERKRMEEQLLQAEKLRAVGEMASGVAHDFNNALAAILGNTQLLLYTAHDEELKETLKIIEKVAKDSGQTVRRLQDFTRRRVDQELFKVDVNAIIRDSIEMTKPKWKDEPQSRGVCIEVISNLEEIPSVSGNGSELREVITNMIFNAIEAMPEGGKIEIRTFKKRRDVFIQISDSGIGIAEEAERKIFEPFFTTKPFTNTGLGLSMSYGIIKRFGGEIEVESKVGQGTTFTIILPIGGEEKEEAVSLQPIKKGREARILVIDDDEFVRNVLSRTFAQANHQVTLAENGEKGVQVFKEGKFDIVLTDLGMPGMSGWEVCRVIKEINPQIPVGMITGWGVDKNRNEVEGCDLDFFISKPFDFNQILNVVSETMASKEE